MVPDSKVNAKRDDVQDDDYSCPAECQMPLLHV